MPSQEPRNPLYLLLLVVGLVFVVTAVAVAVVPVLEEKATEAGNPPPPSEFRDALREQGWKWLVGELVVLVVLSIASMGLDWLRSLKNRTDSTTISDNKPPPSP